MGTGKALMRRASTCWRATVAGILLVALTAAVVLPGCSNTVQDSHHTQDGKVIVRVSMFNASSFPEWRAYVEKQCPDVYIDWKDNRNTFSNVIYEAEHGSMADLVCLRKFESDSARKLEPYLADLSGLDITGTFESDALTSFRFNGKQCWLPEPGTMEGLWANATLFELYGIEMPTDMASFLSACEKMEAQGKTAMATSCTQGYSCVALMEGFGAADYLGSSGGLAWTAAFESGTATTVDAEGFNRIGAILCELRDAGALTSQDANASPLEVSTQINTGVAAISLKASDGILNLSSSYKMEALPFFGETSDDSCLFTYPVFSVGMAKDAEGDSARRAACTEVLEAMFGSDAQELLNKGTEGLISYNKDVTLGLNASMESVRPLIEQRRYFIRALNANTFSAAKKAIGVIVGGGNSSAFVETLNEGLFKEVTPTVVGTSNVEGNASLDSNMCSSSGSILAQSVLSQTDANLVVVDSREVASPIFKGSYTDTDVSAVVLDDAVYQATLTGAEFRQLMDDSIVCTTTFSQGSTEPLLDYPAVAGATVTMRKDGTITSIVTSGGKPLDDGQSYTVVVSERIYNAMKERGSSLLDGFTKLDKGLLACLTSSLSSGGWQQAQEYYAVDEADNA